MLRKVGEEIGQGASLRSPSAPTPYTKAIRASAEGMLKPNHAASPPTSPARRMPRCVVPG